MKFFGEARFIFNGESEPGPPGAVPISQAPGQPTGQAPGQPAGQPSEKPEDAAKKAAEAEAKKAEEERKLAEAKKAAEAKTEAKKGFEKVQTDISLEDLKDELGERGVDVWKEFLTSAGLEEEKFRGAVPNDLNFDSAGFEPPLKRKILEKLEGRDLKKVEEFFDTKGKNIKDIIASIYVKSFISKLKSELSGMKGEYFKEYVKKNPEVVVKYEIVISNSVPKVTFTPSNFQEDLKKVAEEERKAETPEGQSEAEIKEVAKKLAASFPVGMILGFMGYGKVKEGEKLTGFEKIARGEDIFGVVVAGLFGFKGGKVKEAYDGLVSILPERHQKELEKWEKRAQGVGKKKKKKGEAGKEAAEKPSEEEYEEVDLAKFTDILRKRGETLPEKGVVLTEKCELGKAGRPKVLKVDLSEGGEIVLPEKTYKVKVNGKTVTVGDGETLTLTEDDAIADNKVVLEGTLPVGTVFTGTMAFS